MSTRRKRPARSGASHGLTPLPFPVTEYEERAEKAVRSGEFASVGKALYAYSRHPLRIDYVGRVRLRWPQEEANRLEIPVKEYLGAVSVLLDIGGYVYDEGIYYHAIPHAEPGDSTGAALLKNTTGNL